jgi:hypothetical protein
MTTDAIEASIVVVVAGGRESDRNVTSVTFVPAARITGTGWARVTKLQPAPVPVSARSLGPYGFINL